MATLLHASLLYWALIVEEASLQSLGQANRGREWSKTAIIGLYHSLRSFQSRKLILLTMPLCSSVEIFSFHGVAGHISQAVTTLERVFTLYGYWQREQRHPLRVVLVRSLRVHLVYISLDRHGITTI